jgi:putative membrane protein
MRNHGHGIKAKHSANLALYHPEATPMLLLLQWILSALSFMVVSHLLPGFHVRDFGSALVVAAVYGVLHVLLFRVLLFLAFIPVILTFGLFIFVINALLLFLTAALLKQFQIDGFFTAILGAVLLTILNGIWRWLLF